MKGDFTRLSFDQDKHYRAVLMQQGRALLDSDWNEQVQIAEDRFATFFSDFVGQSGAPAEGGIAVVQTGGPTYGSALWFDGAESCLQIPKMTLSPRIELWFQRDTLAGGCLLSWARLFDIGFFKQYLAVRPSGSEEWLYKEEPELLAKPERWYQLIVTTSFNVRKKEITLQLEINGGGSVSFTIAPPELPTETTACVAGARAGEGAPSEYWKGALSDLRFLGKVGLGPSSQLRMVHHYPFDEPSGTPYARDTVTGSHTPITGPALRTAGPVLSEGERKLFLSQGSFYVGGLLVENLTDRPLNDLIGQRLMQEGTYLVYLDVWQRLVTALEDPQLREPALGGPDTTVRLKTEWQVGCQPVGDLHADTVTIGKRFRPQWPEPADETESWLLPLSTGMLAVQTSGGHPSDNRLYRVEIHAGGSAKQATFKWSRDNGSVAASVSGVEKDNCTLTLDNPDLALMEAFQGAQWVEVSSLAQEQRGESGVLVKLAELRGEASLVLSEALDATLLAEAPLIVRRWEADALPLRKGADSAGYVEIEAGLRIIFAAEGYYRSGDYWLIPLRAGAEPSGWEDGKPQRPHGVQHHYAALALLRHDEAGASLVDSLRVTFQPLSKGNVSKAGDTIDGNLCVRGSLSIGTDIYRAPLSVTALSDSGALISFADGAGVEAWRVRHSGGGTPSLSITDPAGDGLTIQRGGNVGIGMPEPEEKLVIQSSAGKKDVSLLFRTEDGSTPNEFFDAIRLRAGWHGANSSAWRDQRLSIQGKFSRNPDDWSDIMTVKADGNVGIGTTDPKAKLEINLVNPNGWAGNMEGMRLTSPDQQYFLGIQPYVIKSGNVGYQFRPSKLGATYEGLTIDTYGNVGIGTPEPKAKLEVTGHIAAASSDRQRFVELWYDNAIIAHNLDALRIGHASDLGAGGWSEKMRITPEGNVGIGCDPHARLDINANGQRQISTTQWADMSANSTGWGLFAGNAYVMYDGTEHFKFANTHLNIGAIGFAVNYPDWNTASIISSGAIPQGERILIWLYM